MQEKSQQKLYKDSVQIPFRFISATNQIYYMVKIE